MHRRSAIHFNVIVVSRRNRAAIFTFSQSPFRRSLNSSSTHPRRLNSSTTIRAACCSADSCFSCPLIWASNSSLNRWLPRYQPRRTVFHSPRSFSCPRRCSIICPNCSCPAGTVLGNTHFPKQPIHPQPGPAFPRRFQIFSVTAPDIIPQRLFRLQQFRPYWIQMNIVTHRSQISSAAAVHHQRLVPATEQVSKHPVPPVKP